MNDLATVLSAWESFYVIVGSSGGALIGLQFVVITLMADRRRRTPEDALQAFGTPTVVHLAGALIVSAIMSAPWHARTALSVVIGAIGVCGLAYGAIAVRRARHQTDYQPVGEDWVWYATLPCAAYAAVAAGGALVSANLLVASFVIGGAALTLLLIGIHNAWDSVTHIVVSSAAEDGER